MAVSNSAHEAVAPAPTPAAPPMISTFTEQHVYSMVGKITDVNCSSSPEMEITVKAQTIVMHLHASDAAQLTIKADGTAPLAKGAACSGLRGRTARVSYQFVEGKKWDAELQTIELRNEL